MGNTAPSKQKFVYSIPVTEPKHGETAIHRAPIAEHGLLNRPKNGIRNIQELYLENFARCPNSQFLGRRLPLADGKLATEFTWETYGEVQKVAQNIAGGFAKLNLAEEKAQFRDYKMKFIGIYGPNTREWLLTDVACMLYGYTAMPVYDTLGEEACEHMFNETELSTLFLTTAHAAAVAKNIKSGAYKFIKNLVILDESRYDEKIQKALEGIQVYTFSQIVEAGKGANLPYPTIDDKQIAFFSYTSGTTGKPKGAMISHKNVAHVLAGAEIVLPFEQGYTHLSYLPLAHVFERLVLMVMVLTKGRYGIFGGDVRQIKEDLGILKPDIFVSVPRLYNKFFETIQTNLRAATGIKAKLANRAMEAKDSQYESGGYYTHKVWDKLVFSKMKTVLGGNVKYMLTGSAPISTEVRKFMKICFSCPFAEGYGQTEGLGGSFLTHPEDPTMGHVGGPIPHLEFKLIDVPEMNYFSTDKNEDGEFQPRGEICVRSGSVIPGYYKDEEKSAEMIDSEGWLHSGDIGTILPNGALKIIDRRKNIFKLSIGEYIAPDKLQEIYKTVRGVSDIYVHGDSLKSVLVGIVFSEKPAMMSIAQELGINGTYEELCQNADINKWFVEQLNAKQKESGLKGFERLAKIQIISKSFEESALLTTTFKVKRHEAAQYYKTTIDTLYIGQE